VISLLVVQKLEQTPPDQLGFFGFLLAQAERRLALSFQAGRSGPTSR
jgi:hypothetical protein